jgi:hypothetical protein
MRGSGHAFTEAVSPFQLSHDLSKTPEGILFIINENKEQRHNEIIPLVITEVQI